LGLTVRQCQALEAGEDPMLVARMWERLVDVFQWPQLNSWIRKHPVEVTA
jgi:hypothetical protein